MTKMQFMTKVAIDEPDFMIGPCEEMLFVGSCFADNIGRRFKEEKFRATVNPYGVMYNPASILHTVERCAAAPRVMLLKSRQGAKGLSSSNRAAIAELVTTFALLVELADMR